jgi:hypothetical protein
MTAADRLQKGRFAAEEARETLRLRAMPGALVAMGMSTEGEVYVARTVVINAVGAPVDLGDVVVHWAQVYGALVHSMTGWVVFRVADNSRIVAPRIGDVARARRVLGGLGYDPARPPYEKEHAGAG